MRRGGRVVEGARLESVYTGNGIAGSNPAPSAMVFGHSTDCPFCSCSPRILPVFPGLCRPPFSTSLCGDRVRPDLRGTAAIVSRAAHGRYGGLLKIAVGSQSAGAESVRDFGEAALMVGTGLRLAGWIVVDRSASQADAKERR